ncbi:hypothetical protein BDM02DRAFT_3138389 [Thelephora ganbajun]|uniref:Uncharacterized protein n=1 Tax=Thelephora ganbajun TaxID=370292 RepID=A0ACB6ZR84_THEGA|nr:hypothetical protein BDM02DRAFT_3138389 [Thelephora ganbajun]
MTSILLPPELWVLILRFALPPRISLYAEHLPFEDSHAPSNTNHDRLSFSLVSRYWNSIVASLGIDSIALNADADPGLLLKYLLDDGKGIYVRSMVVPFGRTVKSTIKSTIEILAACPRIETLIRPKRQGDGFRWNFRAACPRFENLTRLEWRHYSDAHRSGGINLFYDVFDNAPNLEYLAIAGQWYPDIISSRRIRKVHLPRLETLRLRRLSTSFTDEIQKWSLPSMFHVISEFGLSRTEERFRTQIRTLEFVADLRFYAQDRIRDALPLCPNLEELHYYVLFTCVPKVRVQGQAFRTVKTIGLHAKKNPGWTPVDLGGHLKNHLQFVTGPGFPNLRTLALYGDWDGLEAEIPILESLILPSRVSVVRRP